MPKPKVIGKTILGTHNAGQATPAHVQQQNSAAAPTLPKRIRSKKRKAPNQTKYEHKPQADQKPNQQPQQPQTHDETIIKLR